MEDYKFLITIFNTSGTCVKFIPADDDRQYMVFYARSLPDLEAHRFIVSLDKINPEPLDFSEINGYVELITSGSKLTVFHDAYVISHRLCMRLTDFLKSCINLDQKTLRLSRYIKADLEGLSISSNKGNDGTLRFLVDFHNSDSDECVFLLEVDQRQIKARVNGVDTGFRFDFYSVSLLDLLYDCVNERYVFVFSSSINVKMFVYLDGRLEMQQRSKPISVGKLITRNQLFMGVKC